jgi:hypothetical protein
MYRDIGNRKGFCYGVTLKSELKNDPEIKAVDVKFRKNFKGYMIVMALLPWTSFFVPYISISFVIWMIWILILCFYPMYLYAKSNGKVQGIQKARGYENEADKCWKYGMLYCNPKDSRFMVESRMGTGTAMNMASRIGKGMYIFGGICSLIIPIISIWMLRLDFTPISAKVENEKIVCTHLRVEYEISLDDIVNYTIITELPEVTKVTGNGMDRVLNGTFEIYGEGMFEAFLNPQNNLFIKIETDNEMYYISGVDDEQTQKIIDVLEK